MLTEISTKFTPDALDAELTASGLRGRAPWPSDGDEFLLTLSRPTAEVSRPPVCTGPGPDSLVQAGP